VRVRAGLFELHDHRRRSADEAGALESEITGDYRQLIHFPIR
jgi:hypothetical protein